MKDKNDPPGQDVGPVTTEETSAEQIARRFHEAYETRKTSTKSRVVAAAILADLAAAKEQAQADVAEAQAEVAAARAKMASHDCDECLLPHGLDSTPGRSPSRWAAEWRRYDAAWGSAVPGEPRPRTTGSLGFPNCSELAPDVFRECDRPSPLDLIPHTGQHVAVDDGEVRWVWSDEPSQESRW